MSTYLGLLRLAFWTLPLQRWCTVIGAVLIGVGGVRFVSRPQTGIDMALWGCFVTFAIPALLGGALWRAVSSARSVQLAAGGRLRMLAAAIGVAATVGLLLVAWVALLDLGTPPQWRMQPADYWYFASYVFASATWWVLASFGASRSPLGMLAVLLGAISCTGIIVAIGTFHDFGPRGAFAGLWRQSWSIALPCALWAMFGFWYLRARRIAPPGWLLPGGPSLLGAVAMTDAADAGYSRRAALGRLLLGGTSVLRLLTQWLLVGGALLMVLLLIARIDAEAARSVAHLAFAALVLCPIIVATLSRAVVRRARALWLPSGLSRIELFQFVETVLLKLALGMALVFGAFLLLLWNTQAWRPATSLVLMCSGLVVSTLLFTVPVIWRLETRKWWEVAAWVVTMVPLVENSFAGPLLGMTPVGTWWSPAIGLVAIVALRELARRRWLAEDLPRAATSPAS
jgi:hypothetical protein